MNTTAVSRLCHDTAHGIDLFHHVAFAATAERRIAAHLPQGLDVLGQEQRSGTAARRGQGGLGTGVATTHHDYRKVARQVHAFLPD